MITFIDLFAGVGGFHLAFKGKARCVFASEWDKNARKTYLANFGDELLKHDATFSEDITKVDYHNIPSFDILCGGFPCQPFSVAGQQKGFAHETQGNLFFNILDIIKLHKPKVVFLENVKNLQSHDKGNTFKVIKSALETEGYTVFHKILNATTHGNTPQNRERIFIVAFKHKKQAQKFVWPQEIPLTKKWKDCLETSPDAKYYQTNKESASVVKMIEGVKNTNSIYQYRRYYIRENKNGVCPTLTANMGTGGHNVPLILDKDGVRKLTPRECFNFQGYPQSFILPKISDAALYKQAGNSVPVNVLSRIADAIIKTQQL